MAPIPNREELDRRLNDSERRSETRFGVIERMLEQITQRLEALEKRFDALEKRFDALEKRFDALEKRFDALEQRLWENKRTTLLTGISAVLAIAGINYALGSSLIASFQAGQNSAQVQINTQRQFAEMQRQSDQMQRKLDELAEAIRASKDQTPANRPQARTSGRESR